MTKKVTTVKGAGELPTKSRSGYTPQKTVKQKLQEKLDAETAKNAKKNKGKK